jgi:hypothetical protein
MDSPPRIPARFPIAQSISRLLERDLGQGVDARRMLNDPLYARDVLLVCESRPGSELDQLAQRFRQAPAFRMRDPVPTSSGGAPSTGFGVSRPGLPSELPGMAPGAARRAPWYSPARWLGR